MKTQRNNRRKNRRSNNRSKKGGWGSRTTSMGPAWNGHNGGNHFALSKAGVLVGGIYPMKSNSLSKGGSKRSMTRRSKQGGAGGFVFGGFPQNFKIGVDNLKIEAQNVYRGFMGTNQLNSASPWNQPALNAKMGPTAPKFTDISALARTATAKVANAM